MNRRTVIALAAVASVFSHESFAQDPNAKFYGAGVETCEKWTVDRKEDLISGTGQKIQWVLGYISAVESFVFDLYDTKPSEVAAWIDEYCKNNPSQRIRTAAAEFALSIRVGATKKD